MMPTASRPRDADVSTVTGDGTAGTVPATYWSLAGARVRHVLATSPAARKHLAEVTSAQGQPDVARLLVLEGLDGQDASHG